MKLRVIYDKNKEREKWIVWERNITPKGFFCIQTFDDNRLEKLKDFESLNLAKEFSRILAMDESNKPYSKYFFEKYPTDAIRNMTVSEYLTLGIILREANTKYNKKKDEFTTCI